MTKEEKLGIYERNQQRLIRALTSKIKENNQLKEENQSLTMMVVYLGTFATDEQTNAAKIIAEAMLKKVRQRDSA